MTLSRRRMLAGLASSALAGVGSVCAQKVEVKSSLPLKGYIRTNWSQDPFTRGSYSYIAKGSGVPDLVTLGAPIGESVFFAGEAVNPKYQSTVHAAYESGDATADLVIASGRKTVGIIGAGAAGLSAARKLQAAGLNVRVFEARDRVGGRVYSDRSLGPAVEHGAAFIVGTNGNPIAALAEQANAQQVRFLLEEPGSSVVIGKSGRELLGPSKPSWLETFTYSNAMGTDFANVNMQHLMAKGDDYFGDYGHNNTALPAGLDQILRPLQSGYEIQLNAIVSQVNHTQAGAEVVLSNGTAHSFDTVIVTVPLGVLQNGDIKFDPVLSQDRVDAMNRMGMGTVDKLFLFFEEKFWHDAHWIYTPRSDLDRGQFNLWMNHAPLGSNILAAFTPGKPARDLAADTDEELVKKALSVLEIAYG